LKSVESRRRIVTLEVKLAAITTLVLVVVASGLFVQLSTRERARLVAAKTSAATMLLRLLATGLAPAIDFGDQHDVEQRIEDLHQNPDIAGAAVWADVSAPPLASWTSRGWPGMSAPRPEEKDGATASPDWLTATTTIVGPSASALGRIRVVFTLRPENEEFRKTRAQLFWVVSGIAAATAALLALLARRYVAGPLGRLAQAATALAGGDMSTSVDIKTDDEIGDLARAFNVMGKAVAFRQEALEREIELAQRIQTSILPRDLEVAGLEIGALMSPAAEVGGDYYDVLPVEGGAWIGIGDVAGHGLDAGLIMLKMQSIVASLVARDPSASPVEIVCALNGVLYDAIRKRLCRDDHATLTILHYEASGLVTFAGAHEEIVVYRAAENRTEVIQTPGTWVGGRRDIRSGTTASSLSLAAGDVLLLHTDGCTEIRNAAGEELGLDRLVAAFEGSIGLPAQELVQALGAVVSAWGHAEDDVTFLAFRFSGSGSPAADAQPAP
jgi:serine phosphatase RsbU (regulator of sigma subunit)